MSRRRARRAAVEVLYAADVRGCPPDSLAAERTDLETYGAHLVQQVWTRRSEIDDLLARCSSNWTPERMSAVDRNVLRVGALELLEGKTPDAVVIDEAVELAKTFSGQDAARFVNGVLAGVVRDRPA